MMVIRVFFFLVFTFPLKVNSKFTKICLFWSKGQEVAGGKIETGVTIAIEKINNNSNILENTTLRFFSYGGNCEIKRIWVGTIQFVAPIMMDLMTGDCQIMTEIASLVASEYNVPIFDLGLRPEFLKNKNYSTLMGTRVGLNFQLKSWP